MSKIVTATFIVSIDDELAKRSDDELKEFVYDLFSTDGPGNFNWTIEEEEE